MAKSDSLHPPKLSEFKALAVAITEALATGPRPCSWPEDCPQCGSLLRARLAARDLVYEMERVEAFIRATGRPSPGPWSARPAEGWADVMEFDVWCPDDRILVACPGPDDLGDYDCLGHVDPATVPWQVDGPIRVEIEEFYFLGEADARFVALAREVLQ